MPTRICEQCGVEYKTRGLRFCSHSCRQRWFNLNANPAKSAEARAKISAARAGKPTTLGRVTPDSQRENISRALTGRTLSPEHKAAIGAGAKLAGCTPPRNPHLIGEGHPNWRGGHSSVRQADHSNPVYIAFRTAVLERDDWTCQDCRQRGGRLHVHHVKSWGEHPDLRYEPSNGVTLCKPCHHARHRGQPRPQVVGPRTLADLRSGRS